MKAFQPSSSGTTFLARVRASRWSWREVWLRWMGIVAFSIALTLATKPSGPFFWPYLLTNFLATALYWQGNAAIFFFLRRRFPGYEKTARRVALHLLLGGCFVAVATLFKAWLEVRFGVPGSAFGPSYWRALWVSLLASVVITSVYESVYFFYEWRKYFLRSSAFERESAISRFEALKQQVDPHFLFNSLNTMAALIGDNEPAQEFLGALADVYRYVLLSKKSTTVSLGEEMTFVDAYLYLNSIRFGDKILFSKHISPEMLLLRVPPVAVQMLVENAIKHNAVGSLSPLRITIRAAGGVLSVTNTMHRKTIRENSTRQGLQNIVSRFRLLTDQNIRIENRGDEFEVVLPLLPNGA